MKNIKERLKNMSKRKTSGLFLCATIIVISIIICALELFGYVGPLTKLLVAIFFILLFIGSIITAIDVIESRREIIDSIKK